jgi:hypothetical protein
MITNEYGANHLIIMKALRFGSELAVVADSGLWIGHCFALAAGNRYKGESRNTAVLHSTKEWFYNKRWGRLIACPNVYYRT